MIRVLLADDEPMILKGLRKIIHWENYGLEIIGEAKEGKSLWKLARQLKPDIVITDIEMPHMSGIDFIKKLRDRNFGIKVLFISAYEDFAYAKSAIEYGASGYLVKPLDQNLLIQELEKMKDLIKEEESYSRRERELAVYKKKIEKESLVDWFLEMIDGSVQPNDLKEKREYLTSHFPAPLFTSLLISVDHKADGKEDWHDSEKQLLYFAVQNLIDESLSEKTKGCILNRQGNIFSVIVNHNFEEQALELSKNIVERAKNLLKINVIVGIGDSVPLKELSKSFNHAKKNLQYYYFLAPVKIISSNEYKKPTQKITAESLTRKRKMLFYSIMSEDQNEINKKLEKFFTWLVAISDERYVITVSTCFSVLSELLEEFRQLGVKSKLKKGNQEILNDLHAMKTFIQLKEYVRSMIDDLMQQIEQFNNNKENLQIKIVKDYIEENYHQDITLESMASLIHMNPYYFSSFFKKHTKTNFKKYLTDIRMKEALRLLLKKDLLVYEVAERVGYKNVRQFSDMFKKYYKKLPSEYRA